MPAFIRRQSRWASPTDRTAHQPVIDDRGTLLPTAIEGTMPPEQIEAYVTHFRIQEITGQLRLPDEVLLAQAHPRAQRGHQSPDPEYDAAGRRTNTRIQRLRRRLETERHACVERALAKIPSYRLPYDYRRPTRFTDRLGIPQTTYPSVNFIGQILGPRDATLKAMEKQTGATIAIRGKGSVKEGRAGTLARYGAADDGNQPLHVRITSDSQRKVDEGKRLIQQIIDNAVSVPDYQNEHKLKQLRDAAMANGTFRDDEGQRAQHQIAYHMNPARGCASEVHKCYYWQRTLRCPHGRRIQEVYGRYRDGERRGQGY